MRLISEPHAINLESDHYHVHFRMADTRGNLPDLPNVDNEREPEMRESESIVTPLQIAEPGSSGNDAYQVEALTGRQILYRRGLRQIKYKVKWVGYEETTWEPMEELMKNCAHLIYEFHKANPKYGQSPARRGQCRGGARPVYITDSTLWLSNDEIEVYLREHLPESCHLFTDEHPQYKQGINAGVTLLGAHAYLAIVLIDYEDIGSITLIGDSMNLFVKDEDRAKNKAAGAELLRALKVNEAEVLIIPRQTRADVCAYVAIQSLLDALDLIQKLHRLPAMICFSMKKVEKLMDVFGKNYRDSKTLYAFKGVEPLTIRCSYCLDYKPRCKDAEKLKKMHEARDHHRQNSKVWNYRSRPVLKYTL